MSPLDFLNQGHGERATDALVSKLRDAGNVLDSLGFYQGTALELFTKLAEPANGFTPRQRELFTKLVPDAHALAVILAFCAEECEGKVNADEARVVSIRDPRCRNWRILVPAAAAPAPELRYTLRLCFDSAEDLARFEGWLAGQMALPFCKPANGIRRVTTGGRRLYQEGEG